jgi:hypothetical protein
VSGQRASESPRAKRAWLDYLQMGEGRSLAQLVAKYAEVRRTQGKTGVPTLFLSTLEKWSADFGWQARLQAIADQAAAEAEAEIRRQRKAVFEDGLALDFERVRVLKRLAQKLIDDLMADDESGDAEPRSREDLVKDVLAEAEAVLKGTWTEPNRKRRRGLWLRDVKSFGGGKSHLIGFFEQFNRDEVECLRGIFDDIARETGGRARTVKIDLTAEIRLRAERSGLDPDEMVAAAQRLLQDKA